MKVDNKQWRQWRFRIDVDAQQLIVPGLDPGVPLIVGKDELKIENHDFMVRLDGGTVIAVPKEIMDLLAAPLEEHVRADEEEDSDS